MTSIEKQKAVVYLAGPLFTRAERDFNARIGAGLRLEGYEVIIPQEYELREGGVKPLFLANVESIRRCDIVVACMDGPDPDSGTCWEVGFAWALQKPIVQYRTDFRNASDCTAAYNIMLEQSAYCCLMFLMDVDTSEIVKTLGEAIRGAKGIPPISPRA